MRVSAPGDARRCASVRLCVCPVRFAPPVRPRRPCAPAARVSGSASKAMPCARRCRARRCRVSAPGDAVCPGPPHRHPCVRVHAACPGPRRVCPPPGACVRVHVASVRPPGDAVRRCRVSGSALSGSASAVRLRRVSASVRLHAVCPRLSASRLPRRVSASVRLHAVCPRLSASRLSASASRLCVCPVRSPASASVLSASPRLSACVRPRLASACPASPRLSACVRPRRVRPRRRVSAPAAVSRFAPPVRVCPPPPPCVRPRRRV